MIRSRILYSMIAFTSLVACRKSQEVSTSEIPQPVAEKQPYEIVTNGHKRTDDYFWLRLTEEQKNAEVKDEQTQKVLRYLTDENAYLKAKMSHTEALQKKLYEEIVGRIKQTDESVPYKSNGYWYYNRYVEGGEYPIYCRKKGNLETKEEVLLNVNEMSKGHNYYSIRGLSVSEDNNLLIYAEDSVSRRRYTVYVKDLRTGKIIGTPVTNTEGYAVWANDNKTFLFCGGDFPNGWGFVFLL